MWEPHTSSIYLFRSNLGMPSCRNFYFLFLEFGIMFDWHFWVVAKPRALSPHATLFDLGRDANQIFQSSGRELSLSGTLPKDISAVQSTKYEIFYPQSSFRRYWLASLVIALVPPDSPSHLNFYWFADAWRNIWYQNCSLNSVWCHFLLPVTSNDMETSFLEFLSPVSKLWSL